MIIKLLNPLYRILYRGIDAYRIRSRQRHSERALQRLDDRLLDDIGLRRIDGEVVSKNAVTPFEQEQRYRQKGFRLRLIRKRLSL